jgi:iron-sulfur cluster repair protein YtfE (RIC family)
MKSMGINHCCGAGLTLVEAAASVGMPVATVLAALHEGRKAPA